MNALAGTALRYSVVLRLAQAIGALTILSGTVQMIAPGLVLGLVASSGDAMARHFFAIVGMFMVLFGGLLVQTLANEARSGGGDAALLWCALQKFGASAAVGIGTVRGVFSAVALLIAAFDFASGVVLWVYRQKRSAAA